VRTLHTITAESEWLVSIMCIQLDAFNVGYVVSKDLEDLTY